MHEYQAPLRDIKFVRDMLEFDEHYRRLRLTVDTSAELIDSVLAEAARFATSVLSPLNPVGDEAGCTLRDGQVITPPGFKSAYAQYVDDGWGTLDKPPEFGGQGLPSSAGMFVSEIFGGANPSFCAYPGLSSGAIKTLHAHGTVRQQTNYLPFLVNGTWTGTMCLTEAHCGSDLGLLRTRATRREDGSYVLRGEKIFVSAGEHDLSVNIAHIVLARLENAPPGVRGISLFLVPKLVPDSAGWRRNGVACISLERKMGLHGSATCMLAFEGAEAELIGTENRGLACMFTFMNAARLATAQQGVVHAEVGLQKSLAYARERLQMRGSPVRCPQKPADPIISHPDVRRMLLLQRSFAEGGRALIAYASQLLDVTELSTDSQERTRAGNLLSLLTPICKGFVTEAGYESANAALQCLGGHGYIRSWGLEQNVRDARISTLYEGTTGIQALDLLGRKVLGSGGRLLERLVGDIRDDVRRCEAHSDPSHVRQLQDCLDEWLHLSARVAEAADEDPEEVGAASYDYLMYAGYVLLGWMWLRSAAAARGGVEADSADREFCEDKLITARFYFARVLPRTRSLSQTIMAGSTSVVMREPERPDALVTR